MKSLKKLFAGIMAAALCVTTLAPVYAEENEKESEKDQDAQVLDEIGYTATNSLGKYIFEHQNSDDDEADEKNEMYSVDMLTVSDDGSSVTATTSQVSDCTLRIRICPDDGKNIPAAEYSTDLSAGKQIDTVININKETLPESYITEAVLTGMFDREISNVFTDTSHQKESLEIAGMTASDFEDDRVLNLDDDSKSNFIVLSDETVFAKTTETSNILVSADYENGEFIFENADEDITGLKKGDYFCINPTKEDIIAITVGSVKTKDGKTTVKDSGKDISDMFSLIKINTHLGGQPNAVYELSDSDIKKMDIPHELSDSDISKIKELSTLDTINDGLDSITPTMEFTIGIDRNDNRFLKAGSAYFNTKHQLIHGEYSDDKKQVTVNQTNNADTAKAMLGIKAKYESDILYLFSSSSKYELANILITANFHINFACRDTEKILLSTNDYFAFSYENQNPCYVIPDGKMFFGFCPEFSVMCDGKFRISYDKIYGCRIVKHYGEVYINHKEYLGYKSNMKNIDKDVLYYETDSTKGTFRGKSGDTEVFHLSVARAFPIIKTIGSEDKVQAIGYIDDSLWIEPTFLTDYTTNCLHYNKIVAKNTNNNIVVFDKKIVDNKTHLCQSYCMKGHFDYSYNEQLFYKGKEVDNIMPPGEGSLDLYFNKTGIGPFNICQNYGYKKTIVVTKDGKPLPDAKISLDEVSQYTDENGEAEYFCRPDIKTGTPVQKTVSVSVDGKTIGSRKVFMDKHASTLYFAFNSTDDPDHKIVMADTQPEMKDEPVDDDSIVIPDKNEIQEREKKTQEYHQQVIKETAEKYGPETRKFIEKLLTDPDIAFTAKDDNSPVYLGCGQLAGNLDEKGIYYSFLDLGEIPGKEGKHYAELHIRGMGEMSGDLYDENIGKGSSKILKSKKYYQYLKDVELKKVVIENDVILNKDENGQLYVQENPITSIGDSFLTCVKKEYPELEEIIIPNTIQTIGKNAFGGIICTQSVTEDDKTICTGVLSNFNTVTVQTVDEEATIKNADEIIYKTGGFEDSQVREIGNEAFRYCNSLTSINFPDTLTSIGEYAFEHSGLTKAILPDSVKEIEKDAFSYCYDLSEAKISNSINYSHLGTADKGEDNHIGKSVFTGCEKLTKLTVPYISFKWDNSTEGLKKLWYTNEGIYSKARGCNLTTLIVSKTDKTEIPACFCYGLDKLEEVTLPDNTSAIDQYAFFNCKSLKNINISDTKITKIGDYAFQDCTNITSVDFPDSLVSIGKKAYMNCGLTNLYIPDSVTEIGYFAFADCSELSEARISNSIKYSHYGDADKGGEYQIGQGTFAGCKELKTLTTPYIDFRWNNAADSMISLWYKSEGRPTAVSECNLQTLIISKTDQTEIPIKFCDGFGKLETIIIPDNTSKINNYAFNNCTKLKSIDGLSESKITYIGSYAFNNCISLTDIVLPDTLETIDDHIFDTESDKGVPALKTIYLPVSLTSVDNDSFEKCTNLETAYYNGTSEQLDTLIKGIKNNNKPLLDLLKKGVKPYSIVYGDLNGDNSADLTDLTILSVYLMTKDKTGYNINVKAADVDGSGTVDIADLARFKQYVSKDSKVKELGPVKK